MMRSIRRMVRLLYPIFSQSQLSTEQRNQLIREKYDAGEGLSDLARVYRISPQRVYQIVTDKNTED